MSTAEAPYLVLDSAGTERRVLAKPEMSVGRAPENDIRLDQPNISRYHAQFTSQGPRMLLSDLGSVNGTSVNGTRVRGTIELHDGDHVDFAGVGMIFRAGAASAGAPVSERSMIIPDTATRTIVQTSQAALEGEDGGLIMLVKGETTVGRVAGNDLVLPDNFVSRQHARIQSQGGEFILFDLGSSNGTYVNGRRLTEPHTLQPGDEIHFGHAAFVFRQLADPPRQGAVAAFPAPEIRPGAGRVTIEIDSVVKHYRSGDDEVPVLRGVSLQIREGEFVSLVGPSGSGKSTLINMMTGIDYPDSGNITVHGQRIRELSENKLARWRGKTIGLIFQFFQLLPTLTGLENVMLPMDFCGTYPSGKRRQRAMECLALVGMNTFADRLPSALSGGQQQRIAIARALANDPPIILGDEPTGNLDSATAQQIFSLLAQLAQQGKTVALVTHDPLLARSTQRKIEILDGQVVEASPAAGPVPVGRPARSFG